MPSIKNASLKIVVCSILAKAPKQNVTCETAVLLLMMIFFFFIGPGKWGDQRLKAKEGFGQACASLVKIYIKLALSATV